MILLTIQATVAFEVRSLKKLKLLQAFDKFIMSQERLHDFAMMDVGSDIVRTIDFDTVIRNLLKRLEQILVKVHKPINPLYKHELLVCGWVKVVCLDRLFKLRLNTLI